MSEHTVEQPAVKRLERSRSDRMLAGVCGGLARYFDINPAFYRIGFVVLTLIGGAGILVYAAAALVVPDEGDEDSIAASVLRDRRERPWPLVGLGLLAAAGAVLLSRATLWPHSDAAWVLLLLAGGTILLVARRRGRDDHPAPAVAEGAEPTVAGPVQPAHPWRGLLRGLALVVAILTACVLIVAGVAAAVLHVHLGHGIGSRTVVVSSVDDLHRSYSLGIGDLRVDLSSLRLPVGETFVHTRVDVGRLVVVVPADAALRLHAEATFGELKLLGVSTSGRSADRTVLLPGRRVLVLDSHVGAGKLVVARAVR
jgi:phage shock protein PspC (stress-responsive transcriptional regulator)